MIKREVVPQEHVALNVAVEILAEVASRNVLRFSYVCKVKPRFRRAGVEPLVYSVKLDLLMLCKSVPLVYNVK